MKRGRAMLALGSGMLLIGALGWLALGPDESGMAEGLHVFAKDQGLVPANEKELEHFGFTSSDGVLCAYKTRSWDTDATRAMALFFQDRSKTMPGAVLSSFGTVRGSNAELRSFATQGQTLHFFQESYLAGNGTERERGIFVLVSNSPSTMQRFRRWLRSLIAP